MNKLKIWRVIETQKKKREKQKETERDRRRDREGGREGREWRKARQDRVNVKHIENSP